MQKIIALILSLVFVVLLYFNFFHHGESSIEDTEHTSHEESQKTSKNDSNKEEDKKIEEPTFVFKEDKIQEIYLDSISNGEPLVIDVVIPSYYSESFMDILNHKFDSKTVEFNRIETEANTTNLTNIDFHENADMVILSALQIQDYNDAIIPNHNLQNILNMYINLLDEDKIAIILNDPDVFQDTNLENIIAQDQTFMDNNDYYYIDNSDLSLENMYDTKEDKFSSHIEEEIAENFKEFFIK